MRDSGGVLVGYTTTSAHGAETGRTIALGYLLTADDAATADTGDTGAAGAAVAAAAPHATPESAGLTVEAYGFRWPLTVLEVPTAGGSRRVEWRPVSCVRIASL